ncbi:MAG: hypothetical protein IT289_12520 [Oligoflexia bacterium]|nr:hypothetical protein [Oligoflexia bacterium]
MALPEGIFFKIVKDILGFKPDRPIDIITLVVCLIGAILAVVFGVLPFAFPLIAGFIVCYFLLKGIILLGQFCINGVFNICGQVFFGSSISKKIKSLHEVEKFIIHCFIDDNTLDADFNLKKYPRLYFDNLVEKGLIKEYYPSSPRSDIDRLEESLGAPFVFAEIDRRTFDYLTKDYCKNALKLDFNLHRADVRQRNRQH